MGVAASLDLCHRSVRTRASLARVAYVVRRVNYSLANLCFFCFENSFGGVFGCNNGGEVLLVIKVKCWI
jgi:hypothetical protein